MQNLHVDETATVGLVAVDVFGNIVGNAVFTNVNFDNSDEVVATSQVSTDGLTDTLTPVKNAVGKETVLRATAVVNGTTFEVEDTFSVVAGAVAGIQMSIAFNPQTTAQQPSTPAAPPSPSV